MPLKRCLAERLKRALTLAQKEGILPPLGETPEVLLERPQNPEHGDWATSLPLKLARLLRTDPMAVAAKLAPLIPQGEEVERLWAAPPGFINFSLRGEWLKAQVDTILQAGEGYGSLDLGQGKRVQVEFVSANPTGPLHVGHARGAVLGSTLANLLQLAGFSVVREYFVNDAGSQIDTFRRCLYARYQQALGREAEMPPDGYLGDYLVELAREIVAEEGCRFLSMTQEEAVAQLGEIGLRKMLQAIREDLAWLGVGFDVWFSERSLFEGGQYDRAMEILRRGGYLAQREGAVWFVTTALGEDKDNVLVRSSGVPTYFASDTAYHYNKFLERKFDQVINIWGADHMGHIPRMQAVVKALGAPAENLKVIVVQMVTLRRGGEVLRASKRTGELVTLRELLEEVGPDPLRFFFLARSPESQMDFDLELAKRQSSENPVYYIQYAHARIAGILRNAREKGLDFRDADVSLLGEGAELSLIKKLVLFPELVEDMVLNLAPHHLPYYTLDLAKAFHWFYQQCRVISRDRALTGARLKLVEATRRVLTRCLQLMGMEAPERM